MKEHGYGTWVPLVVFFPSKLNIKSARGFLFVFSPNSIQYLTSTCENEVSTFPEGFLIKAECLGNVVYL